MSSANQVLHFIRLRVMGSNQIAIVPAAEVDDFCDGEEYIREDAWMTQEQYEALPEFQGY